MIRAAAIQMASGSNVAANLAEAEKQIAAAVAEGAHWVALPENFGLVGVRQEDVVEQAEAPGSGPIQDFLAQQARQHGIVIAGGSVPVRADDSHYYNRLPVYDAEGRCIAHYDKIHLFDVALPDSEESYQESAVIRPGSEVVVAEVDGIRLGLAICYDLRFPELFRLLVDRGAELFVLPSAFTSVTGQAHWHALLRARAIENLTAIIAPAQGGFHVNGRETYGHSLIVDAWGSILAEKPSGAGFALADINLQRQAQMRARFPVLEHRRFFVSPQ